MKMYNWWDTIKSYVSKVPIPVYIVGAILLVFVFWWFSDAVGGAWERFKQRTFDKEDKETAQQIEDLKRQRDEALNKAREAEAREVVRAKEADDLRKLIDSYGGRIAKEEDKIIKAQEVFQRDNKVIEDAKNGKITMYELCVHQCENSPPDFKCRTNYCDKFKE